MKSAAAFIRLSPPQRRLALRCWLLLVWAAVRVRLWPLQSVLAAIDQRTAGAPSRYGSPEEALRLCAAAARRVWPAPTCLMIALAGYQLLKERDCQVTLVIGGQSDRGDFAAHAWLQRDEVVVLGAPVEVYLPIWEWSAAPARVNSSLASVNR
jgi:hypothetical protein